MIPHTISGQTLQLARPDALGRVDQSDMYALSGEGHWIGEIRIIADNDGSIHCTGQHVDQQV